MSFTEKKKQTPIVKINKNVYAGKTRQRLHPDINRQRLAQAKPNTPRLNPISTQPPPLRTHLPFLRFDHHRTRQILLQWLRSFVGPIHNIPIHHPISLQDDVIKIAWSRIRSHFSSHANDCSYHWTRVGRGGGLRFVS